MNKIYAYDVAMPEWVREWVLDVLEKAGGALPPKGKSAYVQRGMEAAQFGSPSDRDHALFIRYERVVPETYDHEATSSGLIGGVHARLNVTVTADTVDGLFDLPGRPMTPAEIRDRAQD